MFKGKEINPVNVKTPENGKFVISAFEGEVYIKTSDGVSRKISVEKQAQVGERKLNYTSLMEVEIYLNNELIGITDLNGKFAYDHAPVESFTIRFEKEHFSTVELVIPAGIAEIIEFIQMDLSLRLIKFTVVDNTTSTPLFGAELSIIAKAVVLGTTNLLGVLEIPFTIDEAIVTTTKSGYVVNQSIVSAGVIPVQTQIRLITSP